MIRQGIAAVFAVAVRAMAFSQTNDVNKRMLEKSPAADLNNDGALSAGACIAVWLGMHDDLGDPKSPDPVAREATRLSFVVSYAGRPSLDPDMICRINPRARTHRWFSKLFRVSSPSDFDTERVRKLVHDASAMNCVTKDDPPVYMSYPLDLTPIPLPPNDQNMHHPYFGLMLKEKMDARGLESVLHYESKPAQPGEDCEFILKRFFGASAQVAP